MEILIANFFEKKFDIFSTLSALNTLIEIAK